MTRFANRASILWAFGVFLCAALLVGAASRALAGDEMSIGALEFTPPPEVSICFCGSYRLVPEKGYAEYYLAAEGIDLAPYIGRKIEVSGKPFLKPCSGTLYMDCPFLKVTNIEAAPTPTEQSTWGAIKALYR
jgi:hypothetical protein